MKFKIKIITKYSIFEGDRNFEAINEHIKSEKELVSALSEGYDIYNSQPVSTRETAGAIYILRKRVAK